MKPRSPLAPLEKAGLIHFLKIKSFYSTYLEPRLGGSPQTPIGGRTRPPNPLRNGWSLQAFYSACDGTCDGKIFYFLLSSQ